MPLWDSRGLEVALPGARHASISLCGQEPWRESSASSSPAHSVGSAAARGGSHDTSVCLKLLSCPLADPRGLGIPWPQALQVLR